MYERLLLESGKVFKGRRVSGIAGNVVDDTEDITIPVIGEGKATIVEIKKPDNFTPGVQFRISPKVKNDGESDTLFMGLYDADTGECLKDPNIYTFYTSKGTYWIQDWDIILDKTTDFHGTVKVGHVK